jgi:hypothetical protein
MYIFVDLTLTVDRWQAVECQTERMVFSELSLVNYALTPYILVYSR